MPHLLRIEAVNLGSFVYDTSDLSTVRGGSRLLLDAPGIVEERLPERLKEAGAASATVSRISGGASIGLFKVEADGVSAKEIETAANAILTEDEDLRYATVFAVACPFNEATFERDSEALTARVRWRQYQQPTLSVADLGADSARPCAYDLMRPATSTVERRRGNWESGEAGKKVAEPVSRSTKRRHLYGRNEKHALARLAGVGAGSPLDGPAVYHFQQLAENPPRQHRNLAGKIAVLHLDGMNFGKIQAQVADTPKGRTEWDQAVQSQRSAFLKSLLGVARESRGRWTALLAPSDIKKDQEQDHYRLELLTWGGDDIVFVAPAWCGWELASRFMAAAEGSGGGPEWKFRDSPMRYGGGLVFCHAEAPIQRIRALAEELGQIAKTKAKSAQKEGKPLHSALLCLVLESFDDLGGDTEGLLRRRFDVDPADLVLHGEGLGARMIALGDEMESIRGLLSRRKVVAAASSVSAEWKKRSREELRQVIDGEDLAAHREALSLLGDPSPPMFVSLAELWDYIIPGQTASGSTASTKEVQSS